MKNSLLVVAGLSVSFAASANAQASPCVIGSPPFNPSSGFFPTDPFRTSQDACQMALDVFQFMAPQLGLALAGGNATLGAGSTLGGLGHFSVGIRGNFFSGDLPQISSFPTPGTNGRTQRVLPSRSQPLGLPTADAAIGVFGGLPFGLTNVGGVDVLLSAAYIPSFGDSTSDVKVTPDHNLQFGYGVRVGLLSESIVVPGVSVTYIKRDLPNTAISGKSTNLDVNITNARIETSGWRITASKSFLQFGVVVGGGQDKYTEGASIQSTTRGTGIGTQTFDIIQRAQDLTRTNIFADLSLNLPSFKIVGEVGNSTGSSGSVITYSTFSSGAADKSRTYGSVGIRIGI